VTVRDGHGFSLASRHRFADLAVVLAAAVPLTLFLLREQQIAGAAGFPLDDSWIHLHFARNLAEGAGFSYNPGVPVAGSTAPLWTLLLAAGAVLVGPSLALAKVLGVVATVVAGALTRRAALAWSASPGVALAAGIALVWTGPLAWGALSGMEVSLAAALVAGALLAHARNRTVLTATLGALAALARPEAILLLPVLLIARPLTTRRMLVFGVIGVLAVAPFVLFCLTTVGAPWPATATAKVEGGLVGRLAGVAEPMWTTFVQRPWAFFTEWARWLWSTHPVLPFALVPALAAVWWRHGRVVAVPAMLVLVHPLAAALAAPYRGPAFQEGRYAMHLLPLALVVLAAVAPLRWPRAMFAASAIYLLVALPTLLPAATRYGWAVQNINAMQVHLGHWLDRELPRSSRVAVNDIGAIAYFSRREIVDLMGLVTPAIIPYRREGEGGVLRYVVETCPDHVVIFPAWFPQMAARADLLEPRYRVTLPRNEVAGADEMVVYRVKRCAV
jgi:arabinofuranosyltransferase